MALFLQDLVSVSHAPLRGILPEEGDVTVLLSLLSSDAPFWRQLEELLPQEEFRQLGAHIFVSKEASVAENAYLGEYTVIGAGTEVRPGAYIRGRALIGQGCVVGNSTEVKNAILFDGVQAPHYNYVGDSVLGYKAHMGAGAIASNVRADKGQVSLWTPEGKLSTGLRKLGTILGDFAEIGCNSVLCPGSVVGRRGQVYPLSCVRGYVPADSIYKREGTVVSRRSAEEMEKGGAQA